MFSWTARDSSVSSHEPQKAKAKHVALGSRSLLLQWPGSKAKMLACILGIPASRNFLAQARKFKIAGIQSEVTNTAGAIWPSSDACTAADISTFGLGRPVGPAKAEG